MKSKRISLVEKVTYFQKKLATTEGPNFDQLSEESQRTNPSSIHSPILTVELCTPLQSSGLKFLWRNLAIPADDRESRRRVSVDTKSLASIIVLLSSFETRHCLELTRLLFSNVVIASALVSFCDLPQA
jgi:hypothetical protein